MKVFIPLIIALITGKVAAAQYLRTVDSLKQVEQACLDKGLRMPACALQYYIAEDSLMNVVYQKLVTSSSYQKKKQLIREQRVWLKTRDIYFIRQEKEYNDSLRSRSWGPEMRVVTLDKKAAFVEARVRQFIKQLYQE